MFTAVNTLERDHPISRVHSCELWPLLDDNKARERERTEG
jgi:hypothetical protein